MPALTQTQIQSLPDVLSTDRFTVNFGVIPTFGDTSNTLLLKCMDVTIIGTANQRFTVPLATANRSFRGRKEFGAGNTFQCTFVETVDMSSLAALRQWLEYVVGTNSGNSQGYISSYAVSPIVTTYDTTGSIADSFTINRCFPESIQDVPLSTQQTGPVQVNATFSFDFIIYSNTTVT